MKRIGQETRQAIADAAQAIEEAGWEANRRALAREFGVSPQTVARILDGPTARRGADASLMPAMEGRRKRPFVVMAGLLGLVIWISWKGHR